MRSKARQITSQFCVFQTLKTAFLLHYRHLAITRLMLTLAITCPGADVIGVPHGRHDAERGAAEGRMSISATSSSTAYFLVPKPPLMSRPRRDDVAGGATQLVQRGPALLIASAGPGAAETRSVERRHVVGAIALDAKVDAWVARISASTCGSIRPGDGGGAIAMSSGRLALRGVEHREALQEWDRLGLVAGLAGARYFVVWHSGRHRLRSCRARPCGQQPSASAWRKVSQFPRPKAARSMTAPQRISTLIPEQCRPVACRLPGAARCCRRAPGLTQGTRSVSRSPMILPVISS